ncbi:MAG: hypothetical protein ACOX4O_10195 [Eubacteriales bacterium]|jgi:hypothetical protein
MKKGFTAIILALLMAVSLLSCSDRSGNNEESIIDADNIETAGAKEVTETETAVSDDLPELSFEKDFNIFSPSVEHCASYIFSEEMDGDNVNDAKYEMHTAIEQRFGITVHEEHGNTWFPAEVLRKLVASGDSTYDISFCQDNVALEHLDLAYCLDNLIYLDLDKPYWDKGMNDACRISGKAYFAYGAYHMSHYDMTHILAFSKGLIDSLSLENPYDLVRSGAWTIDKLFKMGTTATFDVDGDGVMTSEDSYGFVSTPKQILPCFWIAFGERTIIPDKSEIFILNESEHFFNTLIKTFEVMRDGGIWCVNHEGTQTVENLVSMFGTRRVLFADQSFYFLSLFRDMDEDFGIIPYPKYTDEQENYYSRVEGGSLSMFALSNMTNPDQTGALLEAMASYGYNNVVPEYYEVSLKRKQSRDNDSADMLDLISRSRMVDLGDTWWCGTIRDGFFNDCFQTDNRNFASSYSSLQSNVKATIEKSIKNRNQ